MIEYLILILVFFYFILASIEDIKKREIYDYLNYSLVFLILIVAVTNSFLISSIDPIKYVLFGLLIGFIFGSLLFYLGIWGGGDAKFLIGFSAASYYIMPFISSQTSKVSYYYNFLLKSISNFFSYFLDIFLSYILFFNFLFLVLIFIFILFNLIKKKKCEVKLQLKVFIILFLLNLGLSLNYPTSYLLIIGFIVFLFIFFAEDEIFASIYFKIKKPISNLKQTDILDKNLKLKSSKILASDTKFGLGLENLVKINKENLNKIVTVRKPFPISTLIGLNFILYIIKIISLDLVNMQILFFLIKFLFFSFIAGGIFSIVLVLYYYLKNIKIIKIKFSKLEKISLALASFICLSLTIYFSNIYFALLLFLFFFLKIAKEVEKIMFIKKKDLKDIVFGDWIVEDIVIDKKVIISKEDFKLGVEEEQLKKIQKLSKIHPHLKQLYVKDGIAFIPILFLGFLLILFF